MTASQPDNESIFHAARDIPEPDRRREYVREACGGDEARIAHIEALLAAAVGPDSLLDRPAAAALGATIDQPALQSPGTVIGPYKLIEEIGEGGMGSVWMAQQTEPVRRLVAVKLIKAGMDSRQVIARFEAERQALALMDHPNIARVLDGGTTSVGRPYFVMDLVKGVPITRYCDEHRLTPRQRLELFIPVCQAVQHAHQKGIIHRDLKPSNVLVALYDGKPVPKIIDFGVAKATGQKLTDKTLVTGFGAIVGTLEYMSPEQAEVNQLDIDTRSDIYSLGVLLYELLTGSPPFCRKELSQAGMLEMLRVIREQEPSKPSTKLSTAEGLPTLAANRGTEPARLAKLVRGELDWIVMKALEKDRNRRYETANGFAMDVQCYLADEPVRACPPSTRYRLRKFARKNRKLLVTAAAFVMVLVAGVLVSVWQWRRAERQRDQAEGNFRQAKSAVDDFYTYVSETTLLDRPGLQPLRAELLQRALKYYQDLLGQRREDPRFQAEIAAAHLRLFMIHVAMDSADEAFSALEKALEIVGRLVEASSKDDSLETSVAGFWNVERLLFSGRTSSPKPSDPERAMRALERGSELWQKLARDHPGAPGFRNDLAAFATYIGNFVWDRGDHAGALRAYEKAASLREQLVSENPGSRDYRAALGESRNGLSWFLVRCGREREAEDVCRHAVALQEQLAREFPTVPNYRVVLANCHHVLADILLKNGRLQEALTAARRELEISEKLAAEFPDVPAFEVEFALAHVSLAHTHAAAGRSQEAEKYQKRAIELFGKLSARFPGQSKYRRDQGTCYWFLADVMAKANRPGDVVEACRRAISLFEGLAAGEPHLVNYRRDIENFRSRMVGALGAAGRRQDVEEVYRQAIAFYERIATKSPTDIADQGELAHQHDQLGLLLRDAGRRQEADFEFRKAEEILRKATAINEKLIIDFPNSADYRQSLAILCDSMSSRLKEARRFKEAKEVRRRAIALWERLVTEFPKVPEYRLAFAHSLWSLPELLVALGQTAEVEAIYRKALANFEQLATDFPNEPYYQVETGWCCYTMLGPSLATQSGRRCDAEQVFRRGLAAHEKLVAAAPERDREIRRRLADNYDSLVNLLKADGRVQDALIVYRQDSDFYVRLVTNDPSEPAFRIDLAEAYGKMADLLREAGQMPESEQAARKALEIHEKLAADFPQNSNYRLEVDQSRKRLATIQSSTHPLALARALDHSQAEAANLRGQPDPRDRSEKAGRLYEEGNTYERQGNAQKAKECYGNAAALYEKLTSDSPDVPAYRVKLVETLAKAGRFEEAERIYLATSAHLEQLAKRPGSSDEERRSVAKLCDNLSSSLKEAHRFKEAEEVHRRAIALWEGLVADPPRMHEDRAAFGHSLWHLSNSLIAAGQTSEVEKILRKALAVFEQLVTDFPKEHFYQVEAAHTCWALLGPFLEAQSGRRKDAEQIFRRGLNAHEKMIAASPRLDPGIWPRLASNYDCLVNVLKADGRVQDALKVDRRAVDFYAQLVTNVPDEPAFRIALADAYGKVADLLREAGQMPESEQAAHKSAEIYEKLAADFPNVPEYQSRRFRSWTRSLELADNSAEAARALSKCLELVPKDATNLNNFAWLLATSPNLKARDPKRAVELAKQAVGLAPKEGSWWNTLGAAHYRAGDWNESIETLEKSMALRKGGDASDWFFLAMARWKKGEKEDARKWYGRAVQWMEKNEPKNEELGRFRAEAETLLELKK